MATFVLVHGGWHGGWCWTRVRPLLRAAGHDVFTPTLTGLGERAHLAHPDIDLDTHIADIINVLEYEELQDAVLVGHSSSGAVITGVVDRAPVHLAQLVYLDALVPADGQSVLDGRLPRCACRTTTARPSAPWWTARAGVGGSPRTLPAWA